MGRAPRKKKWKGFEVFDAGKPCVHSTSPVERLGGGRTKKKRGPTRKRAKRIPKRPNLHTG